MKNLIAALLLLLGCADPEQGPPPAKVLPTYTVEYGEIRMVHSEPLVGRSFLLIGNEWYTVETAAIVRQSDGRSFLTVDGQTGEIEGDDGERNTRISEHP